ncbi:MAG: hypothetical protein WBW33_37205 [Bryobacteraceae bacterium]
MIKDNNAPQEQSAQEETHPVSLDHEELEAIEMESVSGGMINTKPCTCQGTGCATGVGF